MSGTGEQLSAFLDNELENVEGELFVRRLGKDEALRATALRYAVIGDVLRGELAEGDPRALTESLAARTGAAAKAPATPARSRWLRPLAGAAVAASVAVVAVLSLQQAAVDELEATAVTVPTEGPEVGAVPAPIGGPRVISQRAGSPDRLSEYYLNHSEYATLLGGQGQLVRIVTTPGTEGRPESGSDEEPDAEDAPEQPPAR